MIDGVSIAAVIKTIAIIVAAVVLAYCAEHDVAKCKRRRNVKQPEDGSDHCRPT